MKRILITGANKGIGLATVRRLLESYDETFLLLGSRDLKKVKKPSIHWWLVNLDGKIGLI